VLEKPIPGLQPRARTQISWAVKVAAGSGFLDDVEDGPVVSAGVLERCWTRAWDGVASVRK